MRRIRDILSQMNSRPKRLQSSTRRTVQKPRTLYLGKDAHEAVHNAVVLEEVAKMADRAEMINPQMSPRLRNSRTNTITGNTERTHIMDKTGVNRVLYS